MAVWSKLDDGLFVTESHVFETERSLVCSFHKAIIFRCKTGSKPEALSMLQHFCHFIAKKKSGRCGIGGFLFFSPCMQEAPRFFEATACTRPEVLDSSHDGAGVEDASVGAPKMLEI